MLIRSKKNAISLEKILIRSKKLANRSCRAGEPETGVFGSLESEPLEKKQGAGAGAAWKKSQEPGR